MSICVYMQYMVYMVYNSVYYCDMLPIYVLILVRPHMRRHRGFDGQQGRHLCLPKGARLRPLLRGGSLPRTQVLKPNSNNVF
jgi:hypothetical protein